MRFLLRDAGAEDGNGNPPAATRVVENPDPPEAAELVRLRRENTDNAEKIKKREIRIAELEDENHRLKIPRSSPAPAAAPKKNWLDECLFD